MVAQRYGDYFDIGAGCRRFLSYGVFNLDEGSVDPLARKRFLPAGVVDAHGAFSPAKADKITEEVKRSRYQASCAATPADGSTLPDPEKDGAYTWLKAPRYHYC